jgi:hypothetical protein
VKRPGRKDGEVFSLLPSEGLLPPIEELESRLESQMAALPAGLDDAHCLYYLCTTRCSGTKCPVFCACDVVVDLEGTADGL